MVVDGGAAAVVGLVVGVDSAGLCQVTFGNGGARPRADMWVDVTQGNSVVTPYVPHVAVGDAVVVTDSLGNQKQGTLRALHPERLQASVAIKGLLGECIAVCLWDGCRCGYACACARVGGCVSSRGVAVTVRWLAVANGRCLPIATCYRRVGQRV